jgi:hypothetical protein
MCVITQSSPTKRVHSGRQNVSTNALVRLWGVLPALGLCAQRANACVGVTFEYIPYASLDITHETLNLARRQSASRPITVVHAIVDTRSLPAAIAGTTVNMHDCEIFTLYLWMSTSILLKFLSWE